EDNRYAESTASAWSVSGNQVDRAKGFGMPAQEVDGHDFFAVWEAARQAIERARAGQGPSLLHVKLNRYYGHFEGDAITYKGEGEIEQIKAEKDALMLFKQRVTETKLLDPEELTAIEEEAKAAIADCLASAKAGALPTEADLMTDVYVDYKF
ncbi:MAG: ABC transporter substrate-binding protein, partial [Rhodospirillales bacterium]|nr:ABC transporter substrate-binding protein [Rhodospirillales bacterium]